MAALGALPVLRRLMLAGCRIPDIRALMLLRWLKGLSLQATQVSDVAPLALLKASRAGLGQDLEARLAPRHHLVLAGE